jgi:hypothetical protein
MTNSNYVKSLVRWQHWHLKKLRTSGIDGWGTIVTYTDRHSMASTLRQNRRDCRNFLVRFVVGYL